MRSLAKDPHFIIVSCVTLMIVIGVASIVPVFPVIMSKLHVGSDRIGLITTYFTIPGIFLSPVAGYLADRFGRHQILSPSLLIFGVFGSLCSLAPDFDTLLLFRFLQGLGVAPLVVVAGTVLGDLYHGPRLSKALGTYIGIQIAAVAVFPAIGGALGALNWRYPFALPSMAIPLAIIVWFGLRVQSPMQSVKLAVYLRNIAHGFTNKANLVVYIAALNCFIFIFGSMLTILPILVGNEFHKSPAQIGMLFSYAAIYTLILSFLMDKLERIAGTPKLIVFGFVLYVFCCLSIPFITTFSGFFLPMTLYGIGNGLVLPSLLTTIMRLAGPEKRAAFNAAYGTVMRLGQAIGPYLTGGILFFTDYATVFYISAGVAALTLIGTASILWSLSDSDQ